MFLGYDYLESHGLAVESGDYKNVYHSDLQEGMTLEGLYEKFNLYRPKDFKGHSLSVGDVVLMSQSGQKQAFFVDTIGFKEISGFDKGVEKSLDAKSKGNILKEQKTEQSAVRKEAALCR